MRHALLNNFCIFLIFILQYPFIHVCCCFGGPLAITLKPIPTRNRRLRPKPMISVAVLPSPVGLILPPFYRAMHFIVQSAVLRLHAVCLSVCNVGGLWSRRLEYIRNNFTISSMGCSLSADPNIMGLLQGKHPKLGPKVTHPLLIWASETFDSKLRPNGYR